MSDVNEIVAKYNDLKSTYSMVFEKALEMEEELRENNLVLNTMTTMDNSRKCWKMIGGILVEKTAEEIKKDLANQIQNIKETLNLVNQQLKKQQRDIAEYEQKYSSVMKLQQGRPETQEKKEVDKKSSSGVLI